ncbi:hypothetical protein SAMN04489712_12170 [Thermomonospora echinospora]|uniref:Uncharacterized protein n=1 Tax=Thermomonospora echinospora TaxID=1992 RepID=A0A1H6DU08_9ACTN|nr:hypothetical protein [Thermomonospora echinospora]SEG88075.1 hypothetical protein SAMN04489712_12170 [Thermomonospora echinospora]
MTRAQGSLMDAQPVPEPRSAVEPDATRAGEPPDLLSRLRAADRRAVPEAADDCGHQLRGFVARGRSRVLVVVLARLVAGGLPGPVNWAAATVSVLVMGAWPYLLALLSWAVQGTDPLHGGTGHLFALATTLTCVAMLALGWTAWQWAPSLADCTAQLLAPSPQRDDFIGWLRGRLRLLPQLSACGAGAGAAALLVFALSHQHGDALPAGVWTYLIAAWTGLMGGEVVYWLYTIAEVPLRLYRCEGLQMTWIDPAHTPAVVQLCRVYARVAVCMALGVLLVELSTLAVTGDRPGPLMQGFAIGLPVFAAVTAIHVGIQPYVTLSRLVRRHIDHIVNPLMAQVTHPPGDLLPHPELDRAFAVYAHFRALRHLPIRTATLLQYVTGILASLIVFFVQRLLA